MDETAKIDFNGLPPSRQKNVAKMGHGAFISGLHPGKTPSLMNETRPVEHRFLRPAMDETAGSSGFSGFPRLRQKKGANMGHGISVSFQQS
jgi:hypothetical protein